MRKYVLIILILLASDLFASQSFVFSRNRSSNSLTYSLYENGVRYTAVLSQEENGKFSVSVPPFLSVKSKTGFFIGELKIDRSKNRSNISSVDSPSLNPSFSGVAKSFRNFDFAVFSPVFNPLSPSGFFFSWHNARLNLNFIEKQYSSRAKKNVARYYQVDWDSFDDYRDSRIIRINLNDSFKSGNVRISSDAFFDLTLVSDCTYGWSLKADGQQIVTSFEQTNDSEGSFCFSIRTKGVFNFGFSYVEKNYPMPVYGGQSKGYVVEYVPFFSYKGLSFSSCHSIEIKQDSGHEESSVYKLSFYSPDMNNNYLSVSCSADLKRGESTSISSFNVRFKDKYSMLEFSDKKVFLSLSYTWYGSNLKCKATITQDRTITLSCKLVR